MSKKVGIIYSETTANNFFNQQAYSQLFASMQYQATMAGIPFDILTEADVTDITKISQYQTLIFPSFQNVNKSQLSAIESTLRSAVFDYKIGLITSGNFLTNDETGTPLAGDPYQRMKELLDLKIMSSNGLNSNVSLKVKDASNSILQGYTAGENIRLYANNIAVSSFDGFKNPPTVLAEQEINGQSLNAVLATQTGGRNVHFSNDTFLNDSNLVWQALQWSIYADQPKVGLNLTRNNSLFASRDDVDLSKYPTAAAKAADQLGTILTDWKSKYGFVGSHFINLGNSPTESPDWNTLRPLYQKWLALGNEIGTHSWTHPFNTNDLNPEQLAAEFNLSKQEIARQLGIPITGASIPGNPENLNVDRELTKYFDYITGVGSTYTNAIGYITPDTTKSVYFAPNIDFDFNLVEFKKLTAPEVTARWNQQFDRTTTHANHPILEFSWHDYGVTGVRPDLYDPQIYTNFIAKAAQSGTEFVTLDDVQTRFKTLDNADLTVNQVGDLITAKVTAGDVGKFGLDVKSNKIIQSVTNWYAYDNDSVFLPKTGGEYQIKLGNTIDPITHIDRLPQRAELLTVKGDGRDLEFQFQGEGNVSVALAQAGGNNLVVEGADSYRVNDRQLELTFAQNTIHTAKVSFKPDLTPLPPTTPPSVTPQNQKIATTAPNSFAQPLSTNIATTAPSSTTIPATISPPPTPGATNTPLPANTRRNRSTNRGANTPLRVPAFDSLTNPLRQESLAPTPQTLPLGVQAQDVLMNGNQNLTDRQRRFQPLTIDPMAGGKIQPGNFDKISSLGMSKPNSSIDRITDPLLAGSDLTQMLDRSANFTSPINPNQTDQEFKSQLP
jgi:serralysin